MTSGQPISLKPLFAAIDSVIITAREAEERRLAAQSVVKTAIQRHMVGHAVEQGMTGIKRVQRCRDALSALDRRGWDRSFHQRLFHEVYLKSCVRIFFKRDGPGAFARNHNRVLELNGWDATPQEVLVSTPRRFGKTISVSMFAAALVFSAPAMELSIYSTCKRISQKLLRNIVKFLELIYLELGVEPYKILRMNSEEIHLAGNEGHGDVRIVNRQAIAYIHDEPRYLNLSFFSYPSKIGEPSPIPIHKHPIHNKARAYDGDHVSSAPCAGRCQTGTSMAALALGVRLQRAPHGYVL